MATAKLDDIIGCLTEMKNLTLQLELKDEEIQKYVNLLLTKKSNDFDQSFMIYTYDTDEDAINLICRNFMEFSEMIYDQHYLLICRKEINRNISICLMPLKDECNLETTLKAVEQLIEMKRKEYENECHSVPSKRIVPELKVMNEKMAEMVNKMGKSEQEMKNEMENRTHQLESVLDQLRDELQHLKSELVPNRMSKIQSFYSQKNLKYIQNSSKILEKMCIRMSVKNNGDDAVKEPPFKDIISMEDKKKELIGYFDLLQKNLDGSTPETEIQKKIRDWMACNYMQLLYKPTSSEKEEWKKEMEQKLKVENTVGTTYYIHCKHGERSSDNYVYFCVSNSKIICWSYGPSKEIALKNVIKNFENHLKWETNAKFAVDIEVTDELSDYFVQVSTDEIMKISDNQKVMEWRNKNFEFLKYNFKDVYYVYSVPAIYSLALKYFEESIE